MRGSRKRLVVRSVTWVGLLAIAAFVVVAFCEMQRDFRRVAPEEEAVVAWIREKGAGGIGKEGPRRHVVRLRLEGAHVSDARIEKLRGLTHLRELDLTGTSITDAGLRALTPFRSLEYLDVSHTRVTLKGISTFLSQNPQVKMVGFSGIDK